MSTAEAGLHGTLKAQFQVPRVAKSNDANIPASISNSGFIIHSTDLIGTDYLSLSFYADKEGTLTAKLCNKNASTCSQTTFTSGSSSLTMIAKVSPYFLSAPSITPRIANSSTKAGTSATERTCHKYPAKDSGGGISL